MNQFKRRLVELEKKGKAEQRHVLTFKGMYNRDAPGAWQKASGLTFSEAFHAQKRNSDT